MHLEYQDSSSYTLNKDDAKSIINNYDNLDEQLLNKKSITDYSEDDIVITGHVLQVEQVIMPLLLVLIHF